jgi:hypothetical protein
VKIHWTLGDSRRGNRNIAHIHTYTTSTKYEGKKKKINHNPPRSHHVTPVPGKGSAVGPRGDARRQMLEPHEPAVLGLRDAAEVVRHDDLALVAALLRRAALGVRPRGPAAALGRDPARYTRGF